MHCYDIITGLLCIIGWVYHYNTSLYWYYYWVVSYLAPIRIIYVTIHSTLTLYISDSVPWASCTDADDIHPERQLALHILPSAIKNQGANKMNARKVTKMNASNVTNECEQCYQNECEQCYQNECEECYQNECEQCYQNKCEECYQHECEECYHQPTGFQIPSCIIIIGLVLYINSVQ